MRLKHVSVMFLILIMMCPLFVSCSNNDTLSDKAAEVDFASNASKFYIHTDCSNGLSFNLALFSKKQIEKVEFVALEGNNIKSEDFNVTIIDNTIDLVKELKYRDLYTKIIMIDLTPNGEIDEICLKKIVLKVDGEIREIEFADNAINKFEGGNVFTETMQISVIPNEFPSDYINDQENSVVYEFVATDDYTLNNIRFVDFISGADMMYAIDQGEYSRLEFPVSVKKGQTLRIGMRFESQVADNLSTVQTNIYFDYTYGDNKEAFNSCVITFEPTNSFIGDDTTKIEKLIDAIIAG